mgnify:CR=1 FL=1
MGKCYSRMFFVPFSAPQWVREVAGRCGHRPLHLRGGVCRSTGMGLYPFMGVMVDILPNMLEILAISDDMVIIGSLENGNANCFGCKGLDGTDDLCHLFSAWNLLPIQKDDQMDMIRHDNIFHDLRGIQEEGFNGFSVREQCYLGILRRYFAQNHCPVFCTNGYEIRAVLAVIVLFQPIFQPDRQLHFISHFCDFPCSGLFVGDDAHIVPRKAANLP